MSDNSASYTPRSPSTDHDNTSEDSSHEDFPLNLPGLPRAPCWVSTNNSELVVNKSEIISRLPQDILDQMDIHYSRMHIQLATPGHLGASGTQPNCNTSSRLLALAVGGWGEHVDQTSICTRCTAGSSGLNPHMQPVFEYCTTLGEVSQGACGNCLWMGFAAGCSLRMFPMLLGA